MAALCYPPSVRVISGAEMALVPAMLVVCFTTGARGELENCPFHQAPATFSAQILLHLIWQHEAKCDNSRRRSLPYGPSCFFVRRGSVHLPEPPVRRWNFLSHFIMMFGVLAETSNMGGHSKRIKLTLVVDGYTSFASLRNRSPIITIQDLPLIHAYS